MVRDNSERHIEHVLPTFVVYLYVLNVTMILPPGVIFEPLWGFFSSIFFLHIFCYKRFTDFKFNYGHSVYYHKY